MLSPSIRRRFCAASRVAARFVSSAVTEGRVACVEIGERDGEPRLLIGIMGRRCQGCVIFSGDADG